MKLTTWLFRFFCFLLAVTMPACGVGRQAAQPAPTAVLTWTPTRRPPTRTPTPTRTATPTATPTPTNTPAPTVTPTPLLLALSGTPLPLPLTPISVGTAMQVSGLAAWQEAPISDLAWSPDGAILAVATDSGLGLYDVGTRTLLRSLYPQGAGVVGIAFRPNSATSTGGVARASVLVLGARRGSLEGGYASSLQLWQGPDWRPLGIFYGTARALSQVMFTPNGQSLVAAFSSPVSSQNTVEFWNTTRWEVTRTITTGLQTTIAFSPSGGLMATSPDRYAIRVWQLKDGKLLKTMPTSFTGAVSSMVFSPGGLLATGHYDGMVRFWDAASGTLLREIASADLGVVQSLAFSPDGSVLATGSGYSNSAVRLWEVQTGDLLATLPGHLHTPHRLLFSPDGQVLVSASYDGELRLWGVRP